MSKFERKTKAVRMAEIREAAKEIFLKKGFRYTTMEDIVKNTTLSKGGVYQYYKTTKAILFDIMQDGNYFRYERTEKIIQTLTGTESPAEIVTQACMAKLLDESPEKRLYLMFLSEMIYDKDYEKLLLTLQKQAFELFLKNLRCPPKDKKEILSFFEGKGYFVLQIFHGMMVIHELFSDKNTFIQNKEKIHAMIFTVIRDFFDTHRNIRFHPSVRTEQTLESSASF